MSLPRARPIALTLLILLLPACASPPAPPAPTPEPAQRAEPDHLALLEAWMTGRFTSTAQARTDPDYFDIHLAMSPVWMHRADGPWLSIEQARADLLDQPYRQRIYHLARVAPGLYRSRVYTLPEPVARFRICSPDFPAAINAISPADLTLLDGCDVLLRFDPSARAFVGGTEGERCPSTREGAKYTTSHITLTDEGRLLVSWDRGFDAQGAQVWGAAKGGYRFIKQP